MCSFPHQASQLVHDLFNSNSKDRFTLIDDLIGDIAHLSKKDEEETSKELTGKKTFSEKIEKYRRQANIEKFIKESFDKFKKNDERMKAKNLTKKRMSLFKEIVEDRINEDNMSSPVKPLIFCLINSLITFLISNNNIAL